MQLSTVFVTSRHLCCWQLDQCPKAILRNLTQSLFTPFILTASSLVTVVCCQPRLFSFILWLIVLFVFDSGLFPFAPTTHTMPIDPPRISFPPCSAQSSLSSLPRYSTSMIHMYTLIESGSSLILLSSNGFPAEFSFLTLLSWSYSYHAFATRHSRPPHKNMHIDMAHISVLLLPSWCLLLRVSPLPFPLAIPVLVSSSTLLPPRWRCWDAPLKMPKMGWTCCCCCNWCLIWHRQCQSSWGEILIFLFDIQVDAPCLCAARCLVIIPPLVALSSSCPLSPCRLLAAHHIIVLHLCTPCHFPVFAHLVPTACPTTWRCDDGIWAHTLSLLAQFIAFHISQQRLIYAIWDDTCSQNKGTAVVALHLHATQSHWQVWYHSPHSQCMRSSQVSQSVGRGGGHWHHQYADHACSQIWCYTGMPRLGSNTPPTLLFRSTGPHRQMNLASGTAPPILRLLKAYKPSMALSITVKNLRMWHLEASIPLARVRLVLV